MSQTIKNYKTHEKFFSDIVSVCDSPGFTICNEISMEAIEKARIIDSIDGKKVTYAPYVIQALALALKKHPEVHILVKNYKKMIPENVEVAVSVKGSSFLAPTYRFIAPERENIHDLSSELKEGAHKARAKQEDLIRSLDKFGWFLGFSWMRKIILKRIVNSFKSKEDSGTVQLTIVPNIDFGTPFVFLSSFAVAMGQVKKRPRVVGQSVIAERTAYFTITADHKVFEGVDLANFFKTFEKILTTVQPLNSKSSESNYLVNESTQEV